MAQTAEAEQEMKDSQTVQSADFAEAADTNQNHGENSIDFLLEMTVPVTITIGRTTVPIKRLLQLGPGSVLQLSKPVEEPVELYLKDTKFAAGTVVVVDGKFAIKVTEIFNTKKDKK